ncbi:MAG: hypothetical protein JWQ04_1714 [Pedosphaera sp.]|nr:hypothetical protein [Pedosphaera sp.]
MTNIITNADGSVTITWAQPQPQSFGFDANSIPAGAVLLVSGVVLLVILVLVLWMIFEGRKREN